MAKPIAKWCRKSTRPSRCPNNRKLRKIQANTSSPGAFSNHNIELVIFHGTVQHLFDGAMQPVDFVNEKDVAVLKVGQ